MYRLFYIILLITAVVLPNKYGACQAYDTSFRTTYYQQKVSLHALLPIQKNDIVFLGNSITDIAEWGEIFKNDKVKNRGISGDITFGVLARLDDILLGKPEKIFLMIGINDLAKNIPDSVIVANYYAIVQRCLILSPFTKIILQSVLPTNAQFKEFKNHQNKKEHIIYLNTQLQAIAKKYRLTYVDVHFALSDAKGDLATQFTNDGLHINGLAYMVWRDLLKAQGLMK